MSECLNVWLIMKTLSIKNLFIFSLLFVFSITKLSAELQLQNYWMVDEYFTTFPEQRQLFNAFNQRVQSNSPQQVSFTKPIKISMVYPGLQVSDYWRRSVASFSARLKEMDVPFEIESLYTKPGVEISLQLQQIRKSLQSDTDYLIFTLDALRHKNLIEQVMAQHRTKVILQNITTPLKAFGQQQPLLYVGFDHSIGSQMLAKKYIEVVENNSKYAILYGTKGYVSKVRGGVFQDIISNSTDMELVASYYVNFDREKAAAATLEIVKTNPDINFIYACSTDIALGVIDALAEKGLTGKVLVNGWGGGSSELEAIQNGFLNFTVMRMNDDNGVAMADAILDDLSDKAIPTIYSGDIVLVNSLMKKAEIDRLKLNAFRYSDHWESPLEHLTKKNK